MSFIFYYIFSCWCLWILKKVSLFLWGVVVLCQENERLFQEWLWRKHLLEQIKKGLTKMGKNISLLCPSSKQEVNCWNMGMCCRSKWRGLIVIMRQCKFRVKLSHFDLHFNHNFSCWKSSILPKMHAHTHTHTHNFENVDCYIILVFTFLRGTWE